MANRVDPDQMLYSAVSDLYLVHLHYLQYWPACPSIKNKYSIKPCLAEPRILPCLADSVDPDQLASEEIS